MMSLARYGSRLSSRAFSQTSCSWQLPRAMSSRSFTRFPTSTSFVRPAARSQTATIYVLQQRRLNSTVAKQENDESKDESNEVEEELSEEEMQEQAKQIEEYLNGLAELWPKVESPVPEWSSDWLKWENLNSYFGPSPYYLNLPQIEMMVNILYGIGGEVIPVLYSNQHDAMLFVVQNEDEATSNFILFHADSNSLKSLPVGDMQELQSYIDEHGSNILELPGSVLEPSQEGQLVVQAIMNGDERILPFVDQFLTMSLQERGAITEEEAAAVAEAQETIQRMQESEEEVDASLNEELEATKAQLQQLLDEIVGDSSDAAEEKRRILEELKEELMEEKGLNELKEVKEPEKK